MNAGLGYSCGDPVLRCLPPPGTSHLPPHHISPKRPDEGDNRNKITTKYQITIFITIDVNCHSMTDLRRLLIGSFLIVSVLLICPSVCAQNPDWKLETLKGGLVDIQIAPDDTWWITDLHNIYTVNPDGELLNTEYYATEIKDIAISPSGEFHMVLTDSYIYFMDRTHNQIWYKVNDNQRYKHAYIGNDLIIMEEKTPDENAYVVFLDMAGSIIERNFTSSSTISSVVFSDDKRTIMITSDKIAKYNEQCEMVRTYDCPYGDSNQFIKYSSNMMSVTYVNLVQGEIVSKYLGSSDSNDKWRYRIGALPVKTLDGSYLIETASNSDKIAVGSKDGSVSVIDEYGNQIYKVDLGSLIRSIDMTGDGSYLVVATADYYLHLLDATGTEIGSFRCPVLPKNVAISNDGSSILFYADNVVYGLTQDSFKSADASPTPTGTAQTSQTTPMVTATTSVSETAIPETDSSSTETTATTTAAQSPVHPAVPFAALLCVAVVLAFVRPKMK